MNDIMAMISYMVSNTYIMLADQSFKQQIGVPMGTNSGGSLIDFYLFQYEFEFMTQLHQRKLWTLFTLFCHTMRYLDDINSINNPHFQDLLYTDMESKEITGVYPRHALTLQLVRKAASTQYMDTILALANHQQAKHLMNKLFTRSYDKTTDDKFRKVQIIKYPSPYSLLPRSTGLNVIITEAHRLTHINMDLKDFISALTALIKNLVLKGFKQDKLISKLFQFFKTYKSAALYGMQTGSA